MPTLSSFLSYADLGTQGTQGSDGTQGTQGLQGSVGSQGTIGAQGLTGSQGTQGLQGFQGAQGIQGTQGIQGIQGVQGIISNFQGTQGTQGPTGYQTDGGVERTINSFTATDGQTTFTVGYQVGYIDVYLNGAKLDASEYTASNGTSIILDEGAEINDIIETISYARASISQIGENVQTTSYTLVLSDVGKYVSTNSNVAIPSGVFSVGDIVSIFNNSSSSISITTTGVTVYLAGTATTGNRTLAQRGLATILCVGTNTFAITGAGIS